ncbi:hypothetical protein ACFV2X_38335 [Streptomyces sp. NPDC059679]|uniref:hypothetical protein n=1 Tax=Streptomyces sp. NPDC059679 TaxID=3346903 RepID=UPI0036B4F3C3
MGASENEQQLDDGAADATCDECGHTDDTVRDLGLKQPIALCDPCFDDLKATRTLAGPLPLSRVLGDVLTGADPLEAGRRSDTWRRTAPDPGPTEEPREDQSA